ncbi:hypothetical protein MN116_000607 [Schistosoma mekongi]|uniref:dolichol kinase n=1 Tax=Schistosoma mekongi TaxID=38744 RepID=A0AAE2D8V9_SCHME|nr:hypothetical protein MN116_000607 [Schistosoma mekongi]
MLIDYHRHLLRNSRKDSGFGLWLGLIVPALLLKTGSKLLAYEFFVSFLLTILLLTANTRLKNVTIPIFICLHCQYFLHVVNVFRPLFTSIFILFFSYKLMNLFPFSFTFGEAILLAHLSSVFLLIECNFIIPFLACFLIERYSVRFSVKNACLMLIILPILIGYLWVYACRVPLAASFITNQVECFIISANFILLIFWLMLFMLCVYITIIYRCEPYNNSPCQTMHNGSVKFNFHDSSITSSDESGFSDQSEYHEACSEEELIKSNMNENKICGPLSNDCKKRRFKLRKLFHFAAGIVYSSGLLWSPHLLSLASAALFIVFWCFEWIRRRGPTTLSFRLSSLVEPFRDNRDSGDILFTPISLLLGLSIPVWWPHTLNNINNSTINISNLCYELKVKPSSWSGVLSIAIGDSFAALIGRAYGRRRWPGSHRTYLGSFASFLSQIITWTAISYHHSWHWSTGIIPLLAGVLVEAYIEQIDNLVVPLVVMLIFYVW